MNLFASHRDRVQRGSDLSQLSSFHAVNPTLWRIEALPVQQTGSVLLYSTPYCRRLRDLVHVTKRAPRYRLNTPRVECCGPCCSPYFYLAQGLFVINNWLVHCLSNFVSILSLIP